MKYPILSGDYSVYIIILSVFLLIAVNLLIASCYIFVKYKNKYTAELSKSREEATLAVEHKNLVLANVSRLIRNQMIRVVGMNELIFRESTDNLTRERTSAIRNSIDDILALMEGVQDYSLLERNLFDMVSEDLDIASLIIDSVTTSAPLYRSKDLVLDLSVDNKLPAKISGDTYKLRRSIIYLLSFACKKNKKGVVKLSVDLVKTTDERCDISFNLHASDLDISLEKIEYLLSHKESANDMIFSHSELDLLDLYLSEKYLTIIGSSLEITNTGNDSYEISFTINSRIIDAKPIGDFRNAYRAGNIRRNDTGMKFIARDARILFIEEKDTSVSYVRELLENSGIELDHASEATPAADKLTKNDYDLILLHDTIKCDDGSYLIDKLRSGEFGMANSRIPAIAVTSDIKSSLSESHSQYKFESYILNPIDPEELEKILIEYMPASKMEIISDYGLFPGIRSVEDIRKYAEGYEDLYENAVKIYKRSKAYKEQ